MGVDDVERRVRQLEGVGVADRELDADAGAGGVPGRLRDDLRRAIEAEHPARCDPGGEIERDRARTAPEVEHVEAGAQVREEVAGRVLRRAPGVAAQHGLVVAMGVDVLGHDGIVAADPTASEGLVGGTQG